MAYPNPVDLSKTDYMTGLIDLEKAYHANLKLTSSKSVLIGTTFAFDPIFTLLSRFVASLTGKSLVKYENDLAKSGAEYMRSIAPYDTGQFYESIQVKDSQIIASQPLATYLNDGTAAHIIEPINSPVLSFIPVGGKFVTFSTHVDHPGTKPTGIIDKTVEYVGKDAPKIMEKLI
jgi:hypothetical protein